MRMPKHLAARLATACLVLGAALALVAPGVGAGANSSEQVVFSKTGAFSNTLGPFGFWIWCEADSSNPYQGACNGSMYFYAFGVPKHVIDGSITELAEGRYAIHVVSASDNGASIDCTLTNRLPRLSGPNNTIDVVCTNPAGSAVASGAVVDVTGP